MQQFIADAKEHGDARRGAALFAEARFACISCHRIGDQGGDVGPSLGKAERCRTAEYLVESVLWPNRHVDPQFIATAIVTDEGISHQGYVLREDEHQVVLRETGTGKEVTIAKAAIDERRQVGTLMPEKLTAAMTVEERRDLFRFLFDLEADAAVGELVRHLHQPAEFQFDPAPLDPDLWPNVKHPVNRDRIYDFYAKEADYFRQQPQPPLLLPEFPGLDGGNLGHWGNQNEAVWASDRWSKADLGSVLSGVFHGPGISVPKAICVRLGDDGSVSACFNPETLCYEMVWSGGFVKLSSVRHGFMDGLKPDGQILARPKGQKPKEPFVYHGFYRHGRRVLFAYRLGSVEMLDAPWAENGKFTRIVAPADNHPLAHLTRGGLPQWPQELQTQGALGSGGPYAVDTIRLPFDNPWKALLFVGDHDFFPDGTALLCTMQGDVWRVEGLDEKLQEVRWRRFASGLHQALGLVISAGEVFVLGRDQITRLHDLNHDGEADFYECFSNKMVTSPAGHDFICGLQRDRDGQFYTASGNQGLLRISADGSQVEVLATGFRNPDGLGLLRNGTVTVPCSEGEWTPASMICQIRPGGYYGYGGPKDGKPPELPLVYLPRGLDNSSGGQVEVTSDDWGPLAGQLLHFSFGAGTHFLVLRDEVSGQPQGAVVPLPGDFLSGVHRGRFNPRDGQLYVSGMAGWGTYTAEDGCFQRVRYTGSPVQLPVGFRVYENGVRVSFSQPVDPAVASSVKEQFAQAWNYRYSPAYGSAEFSPRHFGVRGHDTVSIKSIHVLEDGRTVFLELPDLQPVNQLHLHLRVDAGRSHDLFVTVHKLDQPFTSFPGYQPRTKTIAAHPMMVDLSRLRPPVPNPWRAELAGARQLHIEAGKNLTFSVPSITVRAGEPIKFTFTNPDVVPHNWVLLKPGSLERVGKLVDQSIADPDAVAAHYVPKSDDVIAYADIVQPGESFTIYFHAPQSKGSYPFICTFPGHWMVMNGQMIVE